MSLENIYKCEAEIAREVLNNILLSTSQEASQKLAVEALTEMDKQCKKYKLED